MKRYPTHFSRPGLAAAILAASLVTLNAQAQDSINATPAGRWHTISDVDGKPRGIVEIVETNGVLSGTIIGNLRADEPARVCERCSGERKDKPLLGMTILTGLTKDGDVWSHGEILEPDSGNTYRAKLHLEDGGNQLVVRGYLGISLFGRTQIWMRAK